MRWPWTPDKREMRESQPFTDAIVAALVAQAEGSATGDPSAIAALETAAGLWARAFAAARIEGGRESVTRAITPAFMALVARDLIRRGESVHEIMVAGGELRLAPIGSWDVRGGPDEADWFYRVDHFGPSGNYTRFRSSQSVVHCRYAIDPSRPWFGVSPLGWARSTGVLAGNLEKRLGEEASAPVGSLLPVPADGGGGDDDPLRLLKSDIASAKGRQLLVETTAAAWGDGKASAPRKDWAQSRFGADPPETLATLRSDAAMSVLSACGVPASLATDADGTSRRESWRRFVMGSVEPIARMVAHELAVKLDVPGLAFDFRSLWAHDLQGRAASFKALIAGGVPIKEALIAAGLLADEI